LDISFFSHTYTEASFHTVSIAPFFLRSSLAIKDVSCRATASPFDVLAGAASFAIDSVLVSANLDGVWERDGALDEHRDEELEFKFSIGISSDDSCVVTTRGLESLDLGVPDCERCLELSRIFVDAFTATGALDGFTEELRCLEDSLEKYLIRNDI
jgi:hypothetical protein